MTNSVEIADTIYRCRMESAKDAQGEEPERNTIGWLGLEGLRGAMLRPFCEASIPLKLFRLPYSILGFALLLRPNLRH
jgi:hypothetical protein